MNPSGKSKQIFYNLFNNYFIFVIVLFVGFVFSPCLQHGFVNWDDPAYLTNNPYIRGLNFHNVKMIFLTFVNGEYQPLTILSFAFEHELVQMRPFLYHVNNIILHMMNTLLVFYFIKKLDGNRLIAIVVTLLFALHPTRVESVAWVTERKDVLFLFFYLFSLIFYLKGKEDQKKWLKFYVLSLGAFLCSLFSKPTAMSLPLVLLLIDYYQSRRISLGNLLGKVPFFVLSFVFGLLALLSTYSPVIDVFPIEKCIHLFKAGVIKPWASIYTGDQQFILGFYAFGEYLRKVFWISDLSSFYPYPSRAIDLYSLKYLWPLLLIPLCVVMIIKRNKIDRRLRFGFLLFFITIFSNLPFKNFGHTALMTDRYTYLPYIGIFYCLGVLLNQVVLVVRKSSRKKAIALLAVLSCSILLLSSMTYNRCQIWLNSITLWTDAIIQNPQAAVPYFNRANEYFKQGEMDLALEDYTQAITLKFDFGDAYINRGNVLYMKGAVEKALIDYSKALRLDPYSIEAYLNRASCYQELGQIEAAIADYEKILEFSANHQIALQRRNNAIKLLSK